MKIEQEGWIREDPTSGRGGPLCPRAVVGPGRDPAHAARERVTNALYTTLPKKNGGESSELTNTGETIYTAVTTGPNDDRMQLFRSVFHASSTDPRGVLVEALYLMCPVCGFTLPATRVPPPAESNAPARNGGARGTDTPPG